MSSQSVNVLANRIANVIDVHRKAEDLSNAEVIGVLELIKMDLHAEMSEEDDEELKQERR